MFCRCTVFIIIVCFIACSFVYASEEKIILSLDDSVSDGEFSQVYSLIKSGDFNIHPKELINSIINIFFSEVRNLLKILRFIMIVACINAFVTNFNSSFVSKGVNSAVYLACYCVFALLTAKAFSNAGEICISLINKTVSFLKAAVPVCISFIASIGNVVSGISLKPVYLYFLQFISSFCLNFILPLINSFFAISAVGCISSKISIKNLTDLIKKVIRWTMTAVATVFVASISIMGVVTDKVIFKGEKSIRFLISNFVPVVGRLLSDTIDTVTTSAILIKNTVGIAGVIMIGLICIPPVIKLFAIVFVYKFCSAVIEPVCDTRLSNMLSVLSSSVELMLGISMTVSIILAISVSILLGIGG